MQTFRTITTFFLICFCAHTTYGQFNLGIGPNITFEGPSFGVTGKLGYDVTERFEPRASYTYYFKKNINYAIDLDASYRLVTIEEYSISPLAGFNIGRIEGTTRTAINLGLFIRVDRDWFDIFLEPKMVVDDVSYFVLSGGLYF